MPESLVEVRGVTFGYGREVVLDHVNLTIEPQDFLAVIGPNGGGKTTLLKAILGLVRPWSGEVAFHLPSGSDPRGRLGYVPQFSTFDRDFPLKIADMVLMGRLGRRSLLRPYSREDRAAAGRALERLGLEKVARSHASEVSGGQLQRALIARALVSEPEILFLDEPTTGVDAVSRKEFWDLLGRLRAEGLPIVVSTPYMDEAVRCDRVSLMQGGRFLVTDRPAAIGRAYPRPLLAVRGDDVLGLLGALRSFPHAAAVWPFGESLHYTDARADAPTEAIGRELEAHLRAAGLQGVSLAPIEAGIEDAFMWHMAQERAA